MNLDIVKSIVIPIELAMISFYIAFCDTDTGSGAVGFMCLIVFLTVILVSLLHKVREELLFIMIILIF